ncbi:MAG: hypothetical protein WCE51_13960 [Chthoniobacterales bacterium]
MVGSVLRQVFGSLVAVATGWLAAIVFIEVSTAVELLQQPHYIVPEALIVGPITAAWFIAYFIIPVWLLVLLPLYLFVPSHSALWRWPVCTVCGAIAGLLIISLTFGVSVDASAMVKGPWDFYVLAAIVGGITCLTGALTRRVFKQNI